MSRHTIIKIAAASISLLALSLALIVWVNRPVPDPAAGAPESERASPTAVLPADALRGTLTDSSRAPIQGATLSLGATQATTNARGEFSFATLSEGATLTVSPPEGSALPEHLATIEVPEESASALSLTLPSPASLSGVLLAGGRPLQNADISMLYVSADGLLGPVEPFTLDGLARTDAQGNFSLDALLPGTLQLLIASPTHPFYQSEALTLAPAEQRANYSLDIAPNTLLSLEVVSSKGEALIGDVLLTSTQGNLATQRHRTNEQGKLVLQGLPRARPLHADCTRAWPSTRAHHHHARPHRADHRTDRARAHA